MLNKAEGSDANDLFFDTSEYQQCSKGRIFINPSEEYGLITEVKVFDPIEEDTVLNQDEVSVANEILLADYPELQPFSKRRTYIVTFDVYGFKTEVK